MDMPLCHVTVRSSSYHDMKFGHFWVMNKKLVIKPKKCGMFFIFFCSIDLLKRIFFSKNSKNLCFYYKFFMRGPIMSIIGMCPAGTHTCDMPKGHVHGTSQKKVLFKANTAEISPCTLYTLPCLIYGIAIPT